MTGTIPIERANILGVGVSAIDMGIALAVIDQWIAYKTAHYVCVTPVHGIMECQADPALRTIYNQAGLVTPDGMPVVWLTRSLGFPRVSRVYGPDLMLAVCEHSQARSYRHFFFGGAEGVAEKLAEVLTHRYPLLQVAGTYCPPFRSLAPEEDEAIVATINKTKPDIVWVGLGAPKQERWMAEHVNRIPGAVLIGVGAAFDFHTGRKAQAPRWMQHSGLEWLFRLASEPRRLWRRYLVYNTQFVFRVLLQTTRLRRYTLF